MHILSEQIEEGSLPTSCPDCGFTWDLVKFYDGVMAGKDVTAILSEFGDQARSDRIGSLIEGDETTPLARLLATNGDVMDATIEQIGPEAVANWFTTVGFGIAENYGLVPTGEPDEMFRKKGE